jgi:NitT/TauT family transport system ATP-binding protein
LSLEINRGEFVAVVGPSGCGKTTLLNLLSGHCKATSGVVERGTGERMIYQSDGLFPWQTASENIALGLRDLKDPSERDRQIGELIDLIRLRGFENHYPHQLSGGMRQRVELARALAGDSATLLMDEPFSALDYLARIRMRQELSRILQSRPRTVVLVTHDLEEAAQLADRVVVLTERPARIQCELRIHQPRPRGLTDPEVVRTMERLLIELGVQNDTDLDAAGHGRANLKES